MFLISSPKILHIIINYKIIDKYFCRVRVFSTPNPLRNTGRYFVRIEGKLPGGHVVLCGNGHEEHSFVVRNLNVSVECPRCGTTALSTSLVTEYTLRVPDDRVALRVVA